MLDIGYHTILEVKMKSKLKLYLTLFWEMFRLSAFTFGGGYVIVPLMKRSFVDKLGLLTEKEMLDYTAVAQSAPGAVAINTSILVGMKIGGVAGAAVTLIATILPPLIIISVVALIYELVIGNAIVMAVLRGMRAGVCAVIADAVISMIATVAKEFKKNSPLQYIRIAIMPVCFVASFVFKVNAALIVLAGAIIGIIVAIVTRKAGDAK